MPLAIGLGGSYSIARMLSLKAYRLHQAFLIGFFRDQPQIHHVVCMLR
jgi:hypothetical protein